MSTQLETPVISLAVENNTTIKVSGLSVEHASGYQVKIGTLSGGAVAEQVFPVDGAVSFKGLYPRSIYYVSARALGDDEDYTNSDWCAEQTVVTGAVIDQTMEIPQISATTESFTTIKITGLVQLAEYRYQIATTAAGVESAPIKNTGNSGGYMYIRGLEPGTTYYVRFCKVDFGRCSLWSDIVEGSTEAVTNTITVTSGNDSGEGTLRQAVTDATSGTKIVLDVDTITLNSVISNTSKHLFIIGGKTARTTIQPGNNNALFTITYLSGRHLRFTGNVGSAIALTNGHYDDCAMDSIITTGTIGFASNAGFTNSVILGCVSGNSALRYGVTYNTVIDSCYNTGTNADGGGASTAVLNNCLIRNCTAIRNGGGASVCTLTNCTLSGNYSGQHGGGAYNGASINCVFDGNTAAQNGGGANGGTHTRGYFVGNTANGTAASNGGGGIATATAINCIITGNKALINNPLGGGAFNSQINNCLLYNNTYSPNNYKNDVGEGNNVDLTIWNSTIDSCHFGSVSHVKLYNTLYRYRSATPTGADSNNLSYDGLEEDYFINAANGDYRLKYGSPAINAGDNQYVTTETDLAGNPRIGGTTVDVGAYEFEPYKLPIPTFEIEVLSDGQATISYTLPELSSGFCLQYADNDDFTGASEITSTAAGISLTGMSGRVYFRGKALGISGQTVDSDWTATQTEFFDVTAPIVVVDRTPIEMTVADSVNFLAGVVVTDDSGGECEVHYQVLDSNNQPITVDGQTVDVVSWGIPKGNYMLVITATDSAGNVGTADRGLVVLPPRLPAPNLTLRSVSGTTVVLAGLTNLFATGWQLDHNGTVSTITPDAAGYFVVENLAQNVTHVFKARALGDFVQPEPPATMTGDHRDSDWSEPVSITIVPPMPREGVFYKWTSEVYLSHKDRTFQNVEIRAKITDKDTGELMPPSIVTGAVFNAYYVECGLRTAIDDFTGVEVPVSSFLPDADTDGSNFRFIPDQTSKRLLSRPGYYIFEVVITPSAGNPFNIYSEPIPVF